MNRLRDLISGARTTQLTPEELDLVFSEDPNPELIVSLIYLLKFRRDHYRIFDPDLALMYIVKNAKTILNLLPIGLCLRYGANSNMYIILPEGTFHFIAYAYMTLYNNIAQELFQVLITMLLLKGGNYTLPIFKDGSQSLLEWLEQRNYPIFQTAQSTRANVYAILLDQIELIDPEEEKINNKQIIKNWDISMLSEQFVSPPTIDASGEYQELELSFEYLNDEAFEYFCNLGYLPGYFLISKILLAYQALVVPKEDHVKNKLLLGTRGYESMLISAIKRGVTLDEHQAALFDQELLIKLNKVYSIPQWRKQCENNNQEIPETLKRISLSFGLPYTSKKEICNNLEQLANIESNKLKESTILRQTNRISSQLATPLEFLSSSSPMLLCSNRSLLKTNPYEYSDLDLASYRDGTGTVWCFISPMFTDLISSKINPYTMQELPQEFIDRLNYLVSERRRAGLSSPVTVSSELPKISEPDKISNELTQKIIDEFNALALQNNITQTQIDQLINLDQLKYSELLTQLGFNVDLSNLPKILAYVTFIRAAKVTLERHPELTESFFSELKRQLI